GAAARRKGQRETEEKARQRCELKRDMIRLFTAIELPESVRLQLSLLQGGMPGARWVSSENMHLTLRFIGEVSEAVARDIDDMLADIREPSFSLALRGVGEFGRNEGRALWAGVANGA